MNTDKKSNMWMLMSILFNNLKINTTTIIKKNFNNDPIGSNISLELINLGHHSGIVGNIFKFQSDWDDSFEKDDYIIDIVGYHDFVIAKHEDINDISNIYSIILSPERITKVAIKYNQQDSCQINTSIFESIGITNDIN